MRRKISAAIVTASIALLPLSASALTQNDVASQVQQLLAQVAALTAQLANLTGVASSTPAVRAASSTAPSASAGIVCPTISRSLSSGMQGDDVLSLQHFLNQEGTLDSDSMTGYFGTKTAAAVTSWQISQNVIASASDGGAGLIGAKTRAAIAARCGGTLATPGTIGASLSLSSSQASMQVTANVIVNTGNTCSAQTYTLDWGDDSPSATLSVPAHNCAAMSFTYTHTFGAAGTYNVTVANGPTHVSSPVSVSAPTICTPPQFALNSVPSGIVGKPYTLTLISYPDASSTLTLISTPLPSGLSLQDVQSTSTGQLLHNWTLTGAPFLATSTDVSITAHNDCGSSQVQFSIPVGSN